MKCVVLDKQFNAKSEKSFNTDCNMNLELLSTSFSKIEQKINTPFYLKQVCRAIVNKTISKNEIESILANQNINFSIVKVGFLHLIFEYIKKALSDNV